MPPSITVTDPIAGPKTIYPDNSAQLFFAYAQEVAAAINARMANPSNTAIVIPPPPVWPATIPASTPWGSMNFEVDPDMNFAVNILGQLAEGIDADWNT